MTARERREWVELSDYLQWLVHSHRQAGRLEMAEKCARFVKLVKRLLAGR